MPDWNPDLYARFQRQRTRPFEDLLDLLPPTLGARWLDLGCGDGRLTRMAARRWRPAHVLAVDTSAAMIGVAEADEEEEEGPEETSFSWEVASIEETLAALETPRDLVLSNSALHWVDDHDTLLPLLTDAVAPQGWLAFQMPMSFRQPSHQAMVEVAASPPFADAFEGFTHRWPQREAAFYGEALGEAGFRFLIAEERTYRHPMRDPFAIVEWVRSTGLRPYLERLDEVQQIHFLAAYAQAIDEAYPACDAAGTRLLDYHRLLVVGRKG